jgi:ketosteroid isomerase-like protein
VSQENVEVVLRFGVEFNERGWEALRDFAHPDIEFHEPPEQPGAATFRGVEAVLTAVNRWSEAWERQRATPERVIDLGDTVVVLALNQFFGRDGIELEQPGGNVMTLRDGKIARWAAYWTPQSALEAVGLQE